MKFNKLIPELTVFNMEETRDFYINKLGFQLEYERIEQKEFLIQDPNGYLLRFTD